MVYRFHDYTLDPAGRMVRQGTQRLALEPQVFQVLLYLLERRDRVVPKAELLERCWPGTFVSESALTRCLARLRKAVPPPPTAPPVIETLHRQGYRFVAEVTILAPLPAPAPVDTARPSAPPPLQATTLPVLPVAVAPPVRPAAPGAERRQLTVLCCDLADAPAFAGRLDLEDFREVMLRCQTACTAVIQHYGGHVAQYLGEGLLVYFGWPQAHEDDAQRAVHAGLALLTAVRDLDTALGQDTGLHLALRIGIHTGLVVVGAGEEGTPYAQLAVGATPMLAAKIQALAAPDTVVISDGTAHLVQGYFVCQPLGEHPLPGTQEPRTLYQVLGASGVHSRLDLTPPPQRTPFIGRETELAVLRERATQVRQGQGQVVLLRGEVGIGKSRLLQEVKTVCVADGFMALELRCSPYLQHTALSPVVEWLQRAVQGEGDTPVPARIARLEQLLQQARLDRREHLPLLAALLYLDLPQAQYPALHLTPQRQRQRTLDTLLALLLELAARQPVLLIVEDVHWIDPSTLEWLGIVVDQGPTAPLLTLMTSRPTFVSPWGDRTHVTLLTVSRLAAPQVTQMAQWLGGDRLSAAQLQHIVAQTDGVPLFVEEVTRFVLAAQRLQGNSGGPEPAPAASELPIPATLRDALTARLDQLGLAKGTAQLGATIGREFSYALLQAVSPLGEDLLRQDLAQLVKAELLYQRGVGASAVYVFKHALLREAASASLLRRTRQQYHQHIAQVLETHFPETVVTHPELLAHHYTAAGRHAQAVGYWQQAGQQASARSAHVEAIAHLERGRAALAHLPATAARDEHELQLQLALGAPVIATKGWAAPEVAQVYARALALCQQLGDSPHRFVGLFGLFTFHLVRGEVPTARTLAEECRQLAQRLHEPGLLLEADTALGAAVFYLGEWDTALTTLEEGSTLYDPPQHRTHAVHYGQDPRVVGHAFAAWALWFRGAPAQALAQAHEAVRWAREVAHPFSLAFALNWTAVVHQWCRDASGATAWAEAAMALATEHGFAHWQGAGLMFRGWALVQQGYIGDGIAQLRQGVAAWHATGARVLDPYWLALLAEAYRQGGQTEAGLRTVEEGLAVVHQTAQQFYAAELYRLQGELLLAQGEPDASSTAQAAACFQKALAVARQQQAKSLELRVGMSLARCWQQQGKCAEARALLAPIYAWFTEGFDTADLQDAKVLLEELA